MKLWRIFRTAGVTLAVPLRYVVMYGTRFHEF
jgi:hypothetical protein